MKDCGTIVLLLHVARIAWLALMLALVAGCLQQRNACDDGTVCAAGLVCNPSSRSGCVLPEQVSRCTDSATGDPLNNDTLCSFTGASQGQCNEGVCEEIVCGNGLVQNGEVCDDGNATEGDDCSPLCDSNYVCGNGIVDFVESFVEETCDELDNFLSGDGCSSTCQEEFAGWERVEGVLDQRVAFSAAYDPLRDVVVLFGGVFLAFPCAERADTWQWNGDGWVEDEDSVGPEPPKARKNHSLVWDGEKILLFGGISGASSAPLSDMWSYVGDKWEFIEVTQAQAVSRSQTAAAYHAGADKVVVFGGSDGTIFRLGDTWTWNRTQWSDVTPLNPDESPSPRIGHAMAYDASRDVVVLFGGYDGEDLDDTWEWDGTRWHERTMTGVRPPARSSHGMAYHPRRGRVVLFGGVSKTFPRNDIWEWDGEQWSPVGSSTPPPDNLRSFAMAYHQTTDLMLVLGGAANLDCPGDGASNVRSQNWMLSFNGSEGHVVEDCKGAEDTDDDGLVGCDDLDCWAFCTPHCPPGAIACDADAPRCGDEVCNDVLETPELCPSDC